jgi:hypothetical protein
MGQMHSRERVATVDFSENEFRDNDEKISYCKHCLKFIDHLTFLRA